MRANRLLYLILVFMLLPIGCRKKPAGATTTGNMANGILMPLHKAVSDGDIEQVKKLIEDGADINAQNDLGRTPIYYAIERNHIDLVKLLISKNADVNAKDLYDNTSLHFAARRGSRELTELLIFVCPR